MHILNKYSIKGRLLTIVCLAITFYIGFSTYAIYETKQINNAVNTIYDYHLTIANHTAEAQLRAREMKELLKDAYINREQASIRSLGSRTKEKEADILMHLNTVKAKMLTDEGRTLANEAIALAEEWKMTNERAFNALLNKDMESIPVYFQTGGLLDHNGFIQKLDEINDYAMNRAGMYQQDANQKQNALVTVLTVLTVLFAAMLFVMFFLTTKSIQSAIQKLQHAMADCTANHNFVSVELDGKNEMVDMASDYNKLIHILKDQFLLKDGQAQLNDHISGTTDVLDLANKMICFLGGYLKVGQGAFYLYDEKEEKLKLISSYAYTEREALSHTFALGQGIVGQVGLEKKPILLKNITRRDALITTGTVSEAPLNTFTFPLIHENKLYGVIELASFEPFHQVMQEFLLEASKMCTINLLTAIQSERLKELLEDSQKSNMRLEEQSEMLEQQAQSILEQNSQLKVLLESTRKQAEELQVQQEELRVANEELEEQTEALKMSEEKLQLQQEELRVTNEELEERAKILVKQNEAIVEKNKLLVQAQHEIEVKAEQLEFTSKYKSEFLANMSHELRTPLNSILVLSQMLAEKKDSSPLSEKQLQFAKTIHEAGADLMKLINDILDLSKIEAGRLNMTVENIDLHDLIRSIENQFTQIAALKELNFNIHIHPDIPEHMVNDRQRLSQIIKNLLSNALKFTEKGGVTLTVRRPLPEEVMATHLKPHSSVGFSIKDTGIGIPQDKQDLIFEAFQQVDGTISRKYGGTGLGLSISRELAKNLNGQILMKSEWGVGSTFTLVIPETLFVACDPIGLQLQETAVTIEEKVQMEENVTASTENSLLIIDDDPTFIEILSDLASLKQYHYIVAYDGETGLKLALEENPTAIILDISLPDMNGWDVLEKLRANPKTREIPVHVISGMEHPSLKEDDRKIVSYLQKPVSLEELNSTFNQLERVLKNSLKTVLIADNDTELAQRIGSYLRNMNISTTVVDTAEKAYEAMKSGRYEGLILELELQEISGFPLLEKLKQEQPDPPPVIIHTRKEISPRQEEQLRKYTETVILKGSRSHDRLLAEATLFLHGIQSNRPADPKETMKTQIGNEQLLIGKKILLIDDDMRNIFAISSLLEEKGVQVIEAKNGREGIEKWMRNQDTDLILMDIMMPEMDGYTAMKEIRSHKTLKQVPIIALTAKAMKDDRDKCMDAGANDYLTKPVDNAKLLSLLKVWLYK